MKPAFVCIANPRITDFQGCLEESCNYSQGMFWGWETQSILIPAGIFLSELASFLRQPLVKVFSSKHLCYMLKCVSHVNSGSQSGVTQPRLRFITLSDVSAKLNPESIFLIIVPGMITHNVTLLNGVISALSLGFRYAHSHSYLHTQTKLNGSLIAYLT